MALILVSESPPSAWAPGAVRVRGFCGGVKTGAAGRGEAGNLGGGATATAAGAGGLGWARCGTGVPLPGREAPSAETTLGVKAASCGGHHRRKVELVTFVEV